VAIRRATMRQRSEPATERPRPRRTRRFTFGEAEAEALVQASLGHDHDVHDAFKARAKLITWLLEDPAYVPPSRRITDGNTQKVSLF
jgi:hypothetical protein